MKDEFDPLSMIEVAEQAYHELASKMENASDLQRRYALLAILNGKPPEEVAHACGFNTAPPEDIPDPRRLLQEMIGVRPPTPTDMERFGSWMCQWLYREITGNRAGPRVTTTYPPLPEEDDD